MTAESRSIGLGFNRPRGGIAAAAGSSKPLSRFQPLAAGVSRVLRVLLIVSSVAAWGTAGVGCGGGGNAACDACMDALAQCKAKCNQINSGCICNATVCAKPCSGL